MSFIQKVKIIKQNYANGDYRIFSISPIAETNPQMKLSEYFTCSIKGELSYLSVDKEYTMELKEISSNEKWGGTYEVISVPSLSALDLDTLTLEQSEEILSEITTTTQADYILKAYPDFIRKVLTEGKESIDVKKIYNVGEYRLNAYIRLLTDKYKYLHILQAFKQYEIDITDCKSLYDTYHDDVNITKGFEEKPYRTLINVLGRSFYKTDRLLMEIRPELESECERCEFMILDVLERNEIDGSSKLNANVLYTVAKEDYNSPQLLPLLKKVAIESDLIYYKEDTNELAKAVTYNGECLIASFIKDKINNSTVLDIDWSKYTEIKDGTLTEEQSNILKMECEHNVVAINSKGGTGKTSVLMASIQMFEDAKMSYTLLSPTGRVAQRIKEQTGRSASTIHRACLSGVIDTDVVFVEEGSMISIDLLCMLINAIENPNVRIYFNLDLGQIPPIGVGCPLRDIIQSGIVPTCSLTKVFRYGEGGLYKMATDAYDKKFYINELDPNNNDRVSIGKNKDYTYVKYDGTVEQVLNEYKKFLDRKIKPIDITIITPWTVTDFGTVCLNNEIQNIVNPPKPNETTITRKFCRGKYQYEMTFRIGDLILNTKNCYKIPTLEGYNRMKQDSLLTTEDVESTIVMNGEIGKILDIENGYIIAQFGEEIIVFDKTLQKELLHGWVLTSYKLQGSECPYTITLITPQFENSLNKNIIYTDMSRARKEVVEIIDPNTLSSAIQLDITESRKTWLKELLLDNPQ